MNLRPLGHEDVDCRLDSSAVSRWSSSPGSCLSPASRPAVRVDVVPEGLVSTCVSKAGPGGRQLRPAWFGAEEDRELVEQVADAAIDLVRDGAARLPPTPGRRALG